MKEMRMNRSLLVFLYILAFILLRESLLPIMALTETGYFYLFLLFMAFSFLLALLGVKWFFAVPLKLLYVLWSVQIIYFDSPMISWGVIPLIFRSVHFDISVVTTGEWHLISNVMRTLLFFLMLWMVTYLIQYWIEVKRSIFLFYFTTLAFLATVDTFSPYSVENSIFPVMITGLLLLGLLTITKLSAKYQLAFSFRQLPAVAMPLVFLLVVSMVFSTILPKFSPFWADPVPFIKSMAEQNHQDGQTVSKSGYGTNDEQLGGPFLEDDSLVFEAEVERKQYWKVETKDTYTSKGWEQSTEDTVSAQFAPGELIQDDVSDSELQSAQLTMTEKFPFILYPYGLSKVKTTHDAMFIYNQFTGKYETTINGEAHPLDTYTLEFIEHAYSLKELRKTSLEQLTNPSEFEEYLQLPDTLPERVGELAMSITEASDSVYDKAKAIERHFSGSGFVYERTDVAIPVEEEDYVDQFLFDTKKGYCDNFSSSMVVMLRTLDIPARWVKGFAPGELSKNENGEPVYRVSNNEAHSWVEAYLPDIGWVPFEPTIGFSGVTDVEYDLEDDSNEEIPEEKQEEIERELEEEETEKQEEAVEVREPLDFEKWWARNSRFIWSAIAALVVIATVIYVTRKRWMSKKIIRRYRLKDEGWTTFKGQYRQLLKQLERCGLKRAEGETLASFAVKVDRRFGGDHMQKITKIYEKGIYGRIEKNEEWQRLQEMWEDLIIKTSN